MQRFFSDPRRKTGKNRNISTEYKFVEDQIPVARRGRIETLLLCRHQCRDWIPVARRGRIETLPVMFSGIVSDPRRKTGKNRNYSGSDPPTCQESPSQDGEE